ncbi:YggL family protein [Cupriavidus respiraculi]|uniref:DUF469 family protein n=1 Tax=Cupriavidus respiraculi TaxID=195930 RepID=A0ABN7Y8I4_9BURK|nr:50S ribosome-binding protein YggL [Cupriavidus respiraculi]MBY4947280.1 YggL family protein [Cupriavidus respiraculi]CAG9168854.1 hypothetical protein LMG21510_01267 [Cupriavidus respiraculi]
MKAAHHYNARQRKKHRVGEFQEMGFEFSADLADATAANTDDLLGRFIEEAVEPAELAVAAGINDGALHGFAVAGGKRGSVTPEQRERLEQWLRNAGAFSNVQVGPLRDAWHGADNA